MKKNITVVKLNESVLLVKTWGCFDDLHDEKGVLDTGGDEVDVTLKTGNQKHVGEVVDDDIGTTQLLFAC